jgi:hypothetical protein
MMKTWTDRGFLRAELDIFLAVVPASETSPQEADVALAEFGALVLCNCFRRTKNQVRGKKRGSERRKLQMKLAFLKLSDGYLVPGVGRGYWLSVLGFIP